MINKTHWMLGALSKREYRLFSNFVIIFFSTEEDSEIQGAAATTSENEVENDDDDDDEETITRFDENQLPPIDLGKKIKISWK